MGEILTQRVAVVSGGARGIGLHISLSLLRRGYFVIAFGRSELPSEELADREEFIYFSGCGTSFATHRKAVELAFELFGQIDLYVNNVGLSSWRSIEGIDEVFLEEMLSINLKSQFWGCKAAAEKMSSGGVIVNVSSLAGKRGSKNNSAYCASKFGVNGLTQALAKELGPRGIRVNAVCPVLVVTEGLEEALVSEAAPSYGSNFNDFLNDFAKSNAALSGLPDAQSIGDLVCFLAGEESGFLTGQCINLDSGVFPQ